MSPFLLIAFLSPLAIYSYDLGLSRDQFYLGPEVTYIQREKENKKPLSGVIPGIKIGYDRLVRCGLYFGGDFTFDRGSISYKPKGSELSAFFNNTVAEGRFGYTFQQDNGHKCAITPFIGGGYILERTDFQEPSPLLLQFRTDYYYATAGFLTWAHICNSWEFGFNAKFRYPITPKCHVCNDPENPPSTQTIKEELSYRFDLPITYRLDKGSSFSLTLTPYFEWRHYGTHFNYPFTFIDTQLTFYGLLFGFQYRI